MDSEEPALVYARHMLDDAEERLRYQHEFSVEGFKTLVLINGGAMIGLLTYIGNSGRSANGLFLSFGAYALGLAIATLAYLFAYLSQTNFMSYSTHHGYKALGLEPVSDAASSERSGKRAILTAKVLVILALICFLSGSFMAMLALR